MKTPTTQPSSDGAVADGNRGRDSITVAQPHLGRRAAGVLNKTGYNSFSNFVKTPLSKTVIPCNSKTCPNNFFNPTSSEHHLMYSQILNLVKVALPFVRLQVEGDDTIILSLADWQPRFAFEWKAPVTSLSESKSNLANVASSARLEAFIPETTKQLRVQVTINKGIHVLKWEHVVKSDESGRSHWDAGKLNQMDFQSISQPTGGELKLFVEYRLVRRQMVGGISGTFRQVESRRFAHALGFYHRRMYIQRVLSDDSIWMADYRMGLCAQQNRKMCYGVDVNKIFNEQEMKALVSNAIPPFQSVSPGTIRSHKENADILRHAKIDLHEVPNDFKMNKRKKLTKRQRESTASLGPILVKKQCLPTTCTDKDLHAISFAVTATFGFGSTWTFFNSHPHKFYAFNCRTYTAAEQNIEIEAVTV